jgi:hypothetical protein
MPLVWNEIVNEWNDINRNYIYHVDIELYTEIVDVYNYNFITPPQWKHGDGKLAILLTIANNNINCSRYE